MTPVWKKLVTIDSQDLEGRNLQIFDSPHCCFSIIRNFQSVLYCIRNVISVGVLIFHLGNKSKTRFAIFHFPVRANVEQFPINQNAPGILQLIDKCLSHDCGFGCDRDIISFNFALSSVNFYFSILQSLFSDSHEHQREVPFQYSCDSH